jgi:glycosyltransferase involved in cell wall biosynthesis
VKKIKIGIDARMFSDSFTGIGRYNFELTKRFFGTPSNSPLEGGENVEWVIFLNEPEYSKYTFPSHVKKVLVNAPHYSFAEQVKFLKLLNQEKCDLVHFTHFNAPLLYRGKFVTTIHDTTISFYPGKKMNSWWRKLAYNFVIRHAIGKAKKVITVSDNTKRDVEKLFNTPSNKIQTVHNGIGNEFHPVEEIEKQTVKQKLALTENFLLYTGNWREHKNLVRLLQSFKKILEQAKKSDGPASLKNLQLVITGKPDPYYPEVTQTIEQLELQNAVKLVGLVEQEDLIRLYGAAKMYVFPSLYEGFGLPPLEAMQCLTPVVASRISAIPEVCGNAVQYFDPKDIDDMSTQILKVLLNEEMQSDLIKKGESQIKKFSWDRASNETLKIYQSVLE